MGALATKYIGAEDEVFYILSSHSLYVEQHQ